MVAPLGNKFWQMRSKHGRNPIFDNPDQLWNECVEYFEWVEANPLVEEKVFHAQGIITRATVSKMRAMTLTGLCIYLDISLVTWKSYGENQDFIDVFTRVEQIIREQKFTGAAAELLNPSIIARDLGLSDKNEITGKDGSQFETNLNITFKPVSSKEND